MDELDQLVMRYHAILFEGAEPETLDEDILVKMYQDAIMEVDLLDSYMEIEDAEDDIYFQELLAMLVGYSLGQKFGNNAVQTSHIN